MGITITLVNSLPQEAQTRDQLLVLLDRYALDKWQFTDHVQIEKGVIPHSHPILTLNTRYLADDAHLLSVYIHEQIHWFTLAHREAGKRTYAAFQHLYPDVPVGLPEGGKSEFSNYLHFTVCYFEYKGLIELLGPVKAREIIESWSRRYYRFIYRAVLSDFDVMGGVMAECGLML